MRVTGAETMNNAIPTCPFENVAWRFDGRIVVDLEGSYYFCSTSVSHTRRHLLFTCCC